jgi:ATP-dependent Clp protease adapter protein ClpS
VLARLRMLLGRIFVRPEPRPSVIFPPETSLLQQPGFLPADFVCGLEILNDNTTRMEFVVESLIEFVGLRRTEAIRTMLDIHYRGGVLLPTASLNDAQRIAAEIARSADEVNAHLVCRAVEVRGKPGE